LTCSAEAEDERMFLQEPTPEDLDVHKDLLQRLIADGDHLLSSVKRVMPLSGQGFVWGA
jgi:hypothetical protein